MKLVVGLGNPGKNYQATRHNVGFEVVDELARRDQARFRRKWLSSAVMARVHHACGEDIWLIKPQTYMNRSGLAVRAVMKKYGIAPEDVIVVVDDLDLDIGRMRIRKQGGAGGHNGLRSIIGETGTEGFMRVRVGIGRSQNDRETVDHVLSRFKADERTIINDAVEKAADAVWTIIGNGVDAAMNQFNG